MIHAPDIWREANLLKRCGGNAAIRVAQRADQLLAEGDRDGYLIWRRILRPPRALRSHERAHAFSDLPLNR